MRDAPRWESPTLSVLLSGVLVGLFLFLEDRVMAAGSWKWLAISLIFLACSGVVELRAYRRRQTQAPDLSDPTANPASQAAQRRQICTKTPTELFELMRGKTDIQAENLVAPYLGTWLRLEGTVKRVEEEASAVVVWVDAPENVTVLFRMKKGQYKSEALSLAHGDRFSAIGSISAVSSDQEWKQDSDLEPAGGLIQLRECERVL